MSEKPEGCLPRLGVVAVIVVGFALFLSLANMAVRDPNAPPQAPRPPPPPADPIRGPQPKLIEWDASYAPVNAYLRRVLNDPGSLKMQGCTAPIEAPTAWVVRCEFRATNSFGALVLQDYTFTIRHGQVVAANAL